MLATFGLAIPELKSNSVLSNAIDTGDACDMCKTIARNVQQALTSTKVEEDILEIVKGTCGKFPKEIASVCDALAPVAIPGIIKKLEEGLEIIDICTTLNICDAQKLKAREASETVEDEKPKNAMACTIPTSRNPELFRAMKKAGVVTCNACQAFMSWLEKEVKEADAKSIKAVVAKCPNIPIAKGVCEMVNEQTIGIFVELLQTKVGAAGSCEWMQFC